MSFGRKKRGYQVGKRLARRRGKPRNQDTLAMKTRHTLWSIGKHNQHERLPRKIPRAATQTLWMVEFCAEEPPPYTELVWRT
ncbi:hypothetical protein N665_0033s0005 [Sinapis alba]|nr:hypothetical protein N665_0033s0005 [Sinapis alba]